MKGGRAHKRGAGGLPSWLASVLLAPVSLWQSQLIAIGCLGVAVLARYLIDPLVTGVPFITLFPAIVVAGACGGVHAAIIAHLGGAVVAALLWLRPLEGPGSGVVIGSLIVYLLTGAMIVLLIAVLRGLAGALRRAEDQARLQADEMKHRVSNLLALIQAIATLTLRSAGDAGDFQRSFGARLAALSRAQKLADPGLPTDLATLLDRILEPFDRSRFRLHGPPLMLYDTDGIRIALVVHELATNSMKYGALSVPQGQVTLSWEPAGVAFRLSWSESGGPAVTPPAAAGSGTALISAAFPADLGGAQLLFEPAGVRCIIHFPGRAQEAAPDGAGELAVQG